MGNITPLNRSSDLAGKIKAHLDDLTKPKGSLGLLEDFAFQYCLCKNNVNAKLDKMELYTFAGDHGITVQGVCPYPKEVTYQMVANIVNGGAAISVLCKNGGIDHYVVDMGVDADFNYSQKLINCKVARGTEDFSTGCAMTKSQCEKALEHGKQIALKSEADLLGIGEMGIGNSSSASAIYSMLLNLDPGRTVGAGTGSSGSMLDHKKNIISNAVKMHCKEWNLDASDALRMVGGYEIAGMTGLILGAAEKRIPVVVDGFISGSAALVAMKMNPDTTDYLYFSHASAEQFHRAFFDMVGIRPILSLEMRLGEGSGSALAMQIIKQAMNCYNQMSSFSNAGVSKEI